VFAVESSVQSAISGFNLKCTKSKSKSTAYPKIYKDKFGHVCVTTMGPVRIQRAGGRRVQSVCNDNIDAILFQHEVKEHLHENGFTVDRFLISSQGMPFFKNDDGDAYTACAVMTGSNVDFVDAAALLNVVGHIAKMHCVLHEANITAMPVKRAKVGGDTIRLLGNLTALKKKLLKAGKFSDFDMLFLRGYEELAPNIVAFGDSCSDSICHNLLKEENIYKQDNGQIAIANFAEVAQMHHLHDLAYIIKRYIKAKPHEVMPIDKILETYAANYKNPVDAALFHRILLYPEKFVKLTTDYYSKKRSFAPNTFITRMQECLRVGKTLSDNL